MVSHAVIEIVNTKNKVGSYTDPVSGETHEIYESMLVEPQTGATGDNADGQHAGTVLASFDNKHITVESIQKFEDVSENQKTYMTYNKEGKPASEFTNYVPETGTEFFEEVEDDTPLLSTPLFANQAVPIEVAFARPPGTVTVTAVVFETVTV